MADPSRGDIWLADFDPVVGHEQGGRRPGLVISVDLFNRGPADLFVAVPLTTRARNVALHVPIDPPEGGLRARSYAMCESIRSLAKPRLVQRWGSVTPLTLSLVEDRLRVLLGL